MLFPLQFLLLVLLSVNFFFFAVFTVKLKYVRMSALNMEVFTFAGIKIYEKLCRIPKFKVSDFPSYISIFVLFAAWSLFNDWVCCSGLGGMTLISPLVSTKNSHPQHKTQM